MWDIYLNSPGQFFYRAYDGVYLQHLVKILEHEGYIVFVRKRK